MATQRVVHEPLAVERAVPAAAAARRRAARDAQLGRALVEQGVLAEERLQEALGRQALHPTASLAAVLGEAGFVSEVQIATAIAEKLRIPATDVSAVDIPDEVVALVSPSLARRQVCLPWFVEDRGLSRGSLPRRSPWGPSTIRYGQVSREFLTWGLSHLRPMRRFAA